MAKHKYCGKCIFCTSICPECGAEGVGVKYSPVFTYENEINDLIIVNLVREDVQLTCLACDECIEEDEYCHDHSKLEGLRKALNEALKIPSNRWFKINDDGEMEIMEVGSAS